MFESGEQILDSLKRLRDCSDAAILAVERLLEETRSFSDIQSHNPQQGSSVGPVSLANFVETATYAMNGVVPPPGNDNSDPIKLTAAQFACHFLEDNSLIDHGLSQPSQINGNSLISTLSNKNTDGPIEISDYNDGGSVLKFVFNEQNEPVSPSGKRARAKNSVVARKVKKSELPGHLKFSEGSITFKQREEVTLTFKVYDFEPDFPSSITMNDILTLLLFSRKGNTPMAIANFSNMFQPCFEVEFISNFATSQFDRLSTRFASNPDAIKKARLLMLDCIASWGNSDLAEPFDSSILTANRRPPLLRYYYFTRQFIKSNFISEEDRNKAALQAYMAGISGLCIPSSLNNFSPQAIMEEAVGQLVDRCNSKLYATANHLTQDCWILVAVYGMQFSLQRILTHSWSSEPPYSSPFDSSYELAPFYVAARITQEIILRLEASNGILTLA